MGRCSVLQCKSDSETKHENLSFHSFPEDIHILNQWIKATGRENWSPKNFSRICSRHFSKYYLIRKKKKTLLLPDAVPTLWIPRQRNNQHNRSHEEYTYKTDPLDISTQRRGGRHKVSQEADFKIPKEHLFYTEYIDKSDPLQNYNVNNSLKGSSDNKCSIFVSFVAERLSHLSPRNRLIAQKQIGDILYELEMEEVSYHEDDDSATLSTEEISIKSELESSSDFE